MPNQTDVYLVSHENPEVLAYAMAKYSRSSLSMRDSIAQIDADKSANFLNTFYFAYGHKSIADLAHVAFAIEKLSILAAYTLEDETRWDGQERSTRYQDFSKPEYYTPDFWDRADLKRIYDATVARLYQTYRLVLEQVEGYLRKQNPFTPAYNISSEQYERTIKARSFDVARYLLPLSTMTSLGQIVSARTLEGQISRLRSDRHKEVRNLGDALCEAAQVEGGVPTLVKYASGSSWRLNALKEMSGLAAELLLDVQSKKLVANMVDLHYDVPVVHETVATLLYQYSNESFRDCLKVAASLDENKRDKVIKTAMQGRLANDELLKTFRTGHEFIFDIGMDVGGYRDLHRHRRCIQIDQEFDPSIMGFDVPDVIRQSGEGLEREVVNTFKEVQRVYNLISDACLPGAGVMADYVLPLAARKRFLMKMDLGELAYIAELRTKPAGHFSYRRIVCQMWQQAKQMVPELKEFFDRIPVHDPWKDSAVDLFKR